MIFNLLHFKGKRWFWGHNCTHSPFQYCAAGVFKAKHIFHVRSKYDQCQSAASISRRIKTGFKSFGVEIVKTKTDLMLLHLSMKRPTSAVEFFCHLYYQRPHFWVASFHWQRRNPHMCIVQCTFIRLLLNMLSLSTHFGWVTDFVYLCIWSAFEICPSEREGQ